MRSASLGFPKPAAFAAMAHAIVRIGVRLRECVPALAVRLSRVLCPHTLTTHHVLNRRDGFHVSGIDAPAITAQVVDYEFPRNGADCPLIRYAVRKPVVVFVEPHAGITVVGMFVPEPQPASGIQDLNFGRELAKPINGCGDVSRQNYGIAFRQRAAKVVFAVVGVLARYAAPVQSVRRMLKFVELRVRLVRIASATRLDSFHDKRIIPREHGFLTILQGALVLFVVLAGFGGMQTYRLKHAQNELAGIKAAAQVLEEQNRKKEAADLKLKESKDAEYKRRIAGLQSRYDGVLKSRPSALPAPEPADSAPGALVCFQRDLVESAINGFVRDAARIALEGDQATIGIDVARNWVQELLRRQ